jgi:hypothetical protein
MPTLAQVDFDRPPMKMPTSAAAEWTWPEGEHGAAAVCKILQ